MHDSSRAVSDRLPTQGQEIREIRLQRLGNLRRPGPRVDARVPLLDLAVAVDHHADARRALLRIGVGAVGGADSPVGVTDQRKVEAELLGELLVVFGAVEGRTEDDGVLAIVVGFQVAEPATLGRSARSVGSWVEPKHHRLAGEVRELHGVTVVVTPREIGRLVSRLEHELSLSAFPHDLDGEGLERVHRFHGRGTLLGTATKHGHLQRAATTDPAGVAQPA